MRLAEASAFEKDRWCETHSHFGCAQISATQQTDRVLLKIYRNIVETAHATTILVFLP